MAEVDGYSQRGGVSGFFLKSVAQSVLIFGAETCMVTPRMGRVLGVFQYQVAQQLTGRLPWRRHDGKLEYTSAIAAIEEANFEAIEEYIWRRQNTVEVHSYAIDSVPV